MAISMKVLFIGDIHGAWGDADDVMDAATSEHGNIDLVIQVGDMGFGMPGVRPWARVPVEGQKWRWIDGNHENFDLLYKRDLPNFGYDPYHILWPRLWKEFLSRWKYMPRGTVEDGILYIGGASSIDRMWRTPGLDWWDAENISYADAERTLDAIEAYAGHIHTVISHDCPEAFIMEPVLNGPEYSDGNRKFLDHIRTIVKPDRWYFGHYHATHSGTLDGCEWRCINMVPSGDYVVVDLP